MADLLTIVIVMILIDEILVSEEILEEHFMCNLNACKGACCWEGDYGAPLEPEEMQLLEDILPKIKPFLHSESHALLEEVGPYSYYDEKQIYGTTLHDNGACVFLRIDNKGTARCSIEEAYQMGEITFRKPISCHLYPVRVKTNAAAGFEAMNYDRWEICSDACTLGKERQMPLYRFVKDALIRKYGEAFYEKLDEIAAHWNEDHQISA